MKPIVKLSVVAGCAAVLFLIDMQIASEASAVFGARRRTAMMTAAVVHSEDEQQEQQQAAAAQPAPAPAPQPAATPAAAGALPIGTIVTTLPPNCPEKAIGGVAYYQCGGNSYRAAFQGSSLVYVTAKP